MNNKNLIFIVLVVSSLLQANVPHAYIKRWTPGSYGNYPGISRGKPALPIWVAVSFDQDPDEAFVKNFFRFLGYRNPPSRHRKNREEFILKVNSDVKQSELAAQLDKANRHFDPEIKKAEEEAARFAKERREQEAAARAEAVRTAKEEAEKETEIMRLKKIAEEEAKAQAIRRAQEAARQAQIEAGKKREEQYRKEQEEFNEIKQAEVNRHTYSVKALPDNFYIGDKFYANHYGLGPTPALNNNGQVVGVILPKAMEACVNAAIWDISKGLNVVNLEAYKTIPYSLNDNSFVALLVYTSESARIHERDNRVALWNTNTNKITFGPMGVPRAINNSNIILMGPLFDSLASTWNPKDNSLIKSNGCYSWIDDESNQYGQLFCTFNFNKKGSILYLEQPDIYLYYDGKPHLLFPCEGKLNFKDGHGFMPHNLGLARVNDNNEVAAITIIGKYRKYFAITIWKKNGEETRSKILETIPDLKGYSDFEIFGFNNSGQILLKGYKSGIPRLLLLTPKK